MNYLSCVLIVLLFLHGCSRDEQTERRETSATTEATPPTTSPVKKDRPARVIPLEPSKVATSIGITAENYPFIDGSTSTFPLVRAIYNRMFELPPVTDLRSLDFAISFGTDYYRPLEASKTVVSYELLIAGDVDLIIVPDPSEDVKQKAADAGVELEYMPIGMEALIFITSAKNPVDAVTTEQVIQIYSDMTLTNWADLGGRDGKIIPFCRNKDSGSHAQMENLVLRGKPLHPEIQEHRMMYTMGAILNQVDGYDQRTDDEKKNTYAMGYTLFYYYEYEQAENRSLAKHRDESEEPMSSAIIGNPLDIKPLAVDGVTPTPETIGSREYKFTMSYFAVIRKDEPADSSARKIANWLISEDGQRTVIYAGLGALRPVTEWPLLPR